MRFDANAPLPVTKSPGTPLRVVVDVSQLFVSAFNSASVGIRHGEPRYAVAASYLATRLPVESI